MKSLLQRFDDAARARVNAALKRAEARTAAEILPVVARSSGSYDRAEDIVGLWFAAVLAGLVWILFQGVEPEAGWAGRTEVRVGFWPLLAAAFAGFVAGVFTADRVPALRRLFVPQRDLDRETLRRAKAVFFDRRLHRTSRASGVLVYVSLHERRVAIIADDAVAAKLSERALGEVRDEVASGLKDSDLAGGLERGIERLGNLLVVSFPAGGERQDEVPSELVLLPN
jgi:putative membrane protein